MGNRLFIASVAICCAQAAYTQGVKVKGKVTVVSGHPISEVAVKAVEEKRVVYTDSTGGFAFNVSPFSTVVLSFNGYEETKIKVFDKPIDTVIIMRSANGKSNSDDDQALAQKLNNDNFQAGISTGVGNTMMYGSSINSSAGTFMPVFSHKEETQGSRYLYNGWMKGTVVTKPGTIINDRSYGYNYDKIKGNLFFTQDGESAVMVEHADVTSFTLIDRNDSPQVFKNVPDIDDKHYVQVLAEGPNFNFYKLTRTTFIKSNYHSDGMTSIGNPYDEYEDKFSYYLENVKTRQTMPVPFKRKALKILLVDQKEKSDRYFSDHRDEAVDQSYVKDLIDFVNK